MKAAEPPEREVATALIRIVEGDVSAELLKVELARILPVKWEWSLEEHKEKEFVVPFPSKVELDRLVAIKRIPTDNNEGVLYFEEWNQEIKPKKKLHKVWVRVYGMPYEIRSFLPLWAIGTTLGATSHGHGLSEETWCGSVLVDVLDYNKIPNDTDIVVHGCMYPIYFKLDEVVSMGDDNFDDDDLLDEDEGQEEDEEMQEAPQQEEPKDKSNDTSNESLEKQGQNQQGFTPTEEPAIVEGAPIDAATRDTPASPVDVANMMAMSETASW